MDNKLLFEIALAYRGMNKIQFCRENEITSAALYAVLRRPTRSARINGLVESFIESQIPRLREDLNAMANGGRL